VQLRYISLPLGHPSSPTRQLQQPAEHFPSRPLHFTTRKGHDETVRRLVKTKVCVNPPIPTRRTAYQQLPMKITRETNVLCGNIGPELRYFSGLMGHSARKFHNYEGWLNAGILSGSICSFVGSSTNASTGPKDQYVMIGECNWDLINRSNSHRMRIA
jgi:hypothetical protein